MLPVTYHSLQDLPEAGMRSIDPWALHYGDIELGAVGIRAGVGHTHPTGSIMFMDEVLIRKISSPNTVTSSSITLREVTAYKYTCVCVCVTSICVASHALRAKIEAKILACVQKYDRSTSARLNKVT